MSPSSPPVCTPPSHGEKGDNRGKSVFSALLCSGKVFHFAPLVTARCLFLEFSKFKISENDFFPVFQKLFSEVFSKNLNFRNFFSEKIFFGKFSQNIKSRARSLVEGRHSVVLSLLRPKDDEETKPYIYKYIHIHIHIHRGFFRFRPWPHEKKQK